MVEEEITVGTTSVAYAIEVKQHNLDVGLNCNNEENE